MSALVPRGPQMLRQWSALVGVLLVLLALASDFDVFSRADLALYDATLPRHEPPADIVIVGVDERSLAELGRWPWRRAEHAALLRQLRAAGVRAVALDFIFTEPDAYFSEDDHDLAAAMREGPPTVLPLIAEAGRPGELLHARLPIPVLFKAAAGVGHANVELDRDGIARSVFLREGPGAARYSQLALALLERAPRDAPVVLNGARHPGLPGRADAWVRDYLFHIPFAGPPGSFTTYSFVDVMRGAVPAEALRDKLVLVGATAQGAADAIPTAQSANGRTMAGVEFTANVAAALRTGRNVRIVPRMPGLALSFIVLLLGAFACLMLTPRRSVIVVATLWLGVLLTSVLAMRFSLVWWSPVAALTALALLYPLWSWRRLAATQAFLDTEIARFAAEPVPLIGSLVPTAQPRTSAEPVERSIERMRHATRRVEDLRQLLTDTIQSLPDATLVVDTTGRCVSANGAAALLFGSDASGTLEGQHVDECLTRLIAAESLDFASLAASAPCAREARFKDGTRDLLIRGSPLVRANGERFGTILNIVDISVVRAAQREREEIIRFLSHDLKSPASSLLALAQLQRDPARALEPDRLSWRLDQIARRMIDLLEGFIALARAESTDPQEFVNFDLRDALQDACDEVWAAAEARRIRVVSAIDANPIEIEGDRQLLSRAVGNLLGNAIKYSPTDSLVELLCESRSDHVVVLVRDRGPGIPADVRPTLFQKFTRAMRVGDRDPGGAGLGLAFVRVVATKHRGSVSIQQGLEPGAAIALSLPRRVAARDSAAASAAKA